MTNNDERAMKLKAAAEKVTVLDLDTSQIERGNDGYYECPLCCGLGEVEAETDFCNIDGVALGVQFYGIGEHHGAAEEYFRTVAPANILALLAERDADKEEIEKLRVSNRILASDAMWKQERIAELEARTVNVNVNSGVGCDACGGNGSVDIDHGEWGVEHMECPKCIGEIEPRSLTVKLPQPEQWSICEVLLDKKKVIAAIREACAAAGIKLEVGE